MKVEMLMPQMGESITEATISKWVKKVGDSVKKDEMILEISTDKVDSEIPAPASGVIVELKAAEGDVVPVKSIIALIETNGQASTAAPEVKAAPTQAAPQAVQQQAAPVQASEVVSDSGHDSGSDRFYSPLVRSLAEKYGISLSELDALAGSGQGGRFTKEDFMAYVDGSAGKANGVQQPQAAVTQAAAPAQPPAPRAAAVPSTETVQKNDMPTGEWRADGTRVVPFDNMRKAIAEHMVRSKHTSPHVYSVQEIDVSAISRWRAKFKDEFKKKEGFGLSFTPFFLEAAVKALLQFPIVNSSVDGNSVIYKRNVNLGCAVALGTTGLIVPVIKRAEERNLVGIARGLNDLALRARNKKLLPDEVTGGSFTVTNPGVFGTLIGTPIINQPQVAILCLGAIEKRPVVIDDMIAIRERCYLTLSYDHRVIDGSIGGQFLNFIREYLEKWDDNRTLY